MSMTSLEIALQRIEECRSTRATELNLSRLRLEIRTGFGKVCSLVSANGLNSFVTPSPPLFVSRGNVQGFKPAQVA